MPTTSIDIPELLYDYIESEVEKGRFTSKAEAIRSMIRREMERKHAIDEELADDLIADIEEARERGDIEGDIRELIQDRL